MGPQPIKRTAQQQLILEYAAYVSYVSKLYATLAGPDGVAILAQLFPAGTVIHPDNGLMQPFCPEAADAVHDFLRTGLIAPVTPDNGYQSRDSFVIASEDELNLDHRSFYSDHAGNWILPAHHTIQALPRPRPQRRPTVPPNVPNSSEAYNDRRNKVIDEDNSIIESNATADLNYFKVTLGASTPSDVDDILAEIKSYILANPIGGKYQMGHVVVHGIRDNRLNVVNRGGQHFFIIMLYEGDLYLVDSMLGYKVLTSTQPNLSTGKSFDVFAGVDGRGPTVTKDLPTIRAYFRSEKFRNIRFTKTFDSVRLKNITRVHRVLTIGKETDWGVPDFGARRTGDLFDINNPLLLQPCSQYGYKY